MSCSKMYTAEHPIDNAYFRESFEKSKDDLLKEELLKEAFEKLRDKLKSIEQKLNENQLAEGMINMLLCKIYDEKMNTVPEFRVGDNEQSSAILSRIKRLFSDAKREYSNSLIFAGNDDIGLTDNGIFEVARMISGFKLLQDNMNMISNIYEIFIGKPRSTEKDQFYTPISMAKLMINMVKPSSGDTVLDPACGAGGLLVQSLIKTKNNQLNIVGVDISSFFVKICRTHLALIKGTFENVNIAEGDSLSQGIIKSTEDGDTFGLAVGSYDVVLTNPPFSIPYKQSNEEDVEFGVNVRSGILFLQRSINLLKRGGKLGITLPHNILSRQDVIAYILDRTHIMAIVSFPKNFYKKQNVGAVNKTVFLYLVKKDDVNVGSMGSRIFMAIIEEAGQKFKGKIKDDNDIPTVMKNYEKFLRGESMIEDRFGFGVDNTIDFTIRGLAPERYLNHRCIEGTSSNLETSFHIITLGELIKGGMISVNKFKSLTTAQYIKVNEKDPVPVLLSSEITPFRVLKKHEKYISRSTFDRIFNNAAKKLQVNDILFTKNGASGRLGVSVCITEENLDLAPQSYFYKIRINNEYANEDVDEEYDDWKSDFDYILLLYCLKHKFVKLQTVSIEHPELREISLEEFKNIKILIPNTKEERKIVKDLMIDAIGDEREIYRRTIMLSAHMEDIESRGM